MKRKDLIRTSIVVSILMHMIFFGVSFIWWLPGAEALSVQTRKMFDIKSIPVKAPLMTQRKILQTYLNKLKFKNPAAKTSDFLAKQRLNTQIKRPEVDKLMSAKKDLSAGKTKPSLPAEARLLKQRIKEKHRVVNKETTVELDIFKAAIVTAEELQVDIAVPEIFTEEMFAFTPSHHYAAVKTELKPESTVPKAESKHEAIDEVMQIQLITYRDPTDGQGYFRISMTPGKDAASMKVIPKEIIFLIDASLSIRERRLDRFIRGIKYAIQNLNPNDKFNLYTFKDRITPLSDFSLTSSEQSVRKAIYLLNKLEPSEQTDIYAAFLESIQKPTSMDPSYIMFLSDGKPTQGVTSSAKLIGEISKINNRKRPIFAFSGGARVNRYLLDFLAYQNRGWSEYAASNLDIHRRISELYEKIKNPLMINVRYQFSQLDSSEVYPKHLPDFYLNTAFVVYGKFLGEDKFSMRVLGDVEGDTKEFIFARSLVNAEKGGKEIALHWAFNKFYHLISESTLDGPTPELNAQIKYLTKKFKIKSPY